MRFESVTAYAFGPLCGETLQIAPGMNVIYGPNETGKSTWHAALYAGLCGMRRARGRARTDRDFQVRHKPWDREGWEVGATIALEGRRVTLRHDLDGRVDSSARDADLAGRDYSAEIMNDGAPDGARWLGLDRRSFLSTACVRQASILAVLNDPSDLQRVAERCSDSAYWRDCGRRFGAAQLLPRRACRNGAGANETPCAVAKGGLYRSGCTRVDSERANGSRRTSPRRRSS